VMFISRFVGTWLGQALARSTGTLSDVLTASLHQNPLALAGLMEFARGSVLWLFVPVLLVGVIQSYRLFRTPPQGGVWWMLRCLAPLVAVTVLWSFCAYAGFAGSRWQPFLETVRAIDKAPALLTGEDLAKSQPLTPLTQRWLAGAQIAVDRDPADASRYRTTIHLASGVECKLTVTRAGAMAASCGK